MKYKTIIELICDAANKEDAANIAGDYLRSEVDFGVSMNCRTFALRTYRIVKYAVTTVIAMMFFSVILCRFFPLGKDAETGEGTKIGFGSTCTVVPALKTEHDEGFKEDWEKKQDESVLEFLKE